MATLKSEMADIIYMSAVESNVGSLFKCYYTVAKGGYSSIPPIAPHYP